MRAVVFDLDDTLYPEWEFVAGGLRAAAEWASARSGLESHVVESELTALARGGPRGKTFDLWLSQRSLPEAWRTDLVGAYRAHRPHLQMYADARRALERLKRKYKVGLVTEGDAGAQRAKLAALGVEERFGAVVILGREEAALWKPNPEPFRRCLAALGVRPAEAAYVGDNPSKDFRGAREIGMRTVRVRRHGGVYADLEPATEQDAPDVEMEDLDRLEAALGLPGDDS